MLLKFEHPESFKPLPQVPDTPKKKRKLGAGGSATASGKPRCQAATRISNLQLAGLIPMEHIQVIYHNTPTFDDTDAQHLYLSNVFRQALCERLDDVDFQPCSLFDLHNAHYVQDEEDLVHPNETYVVCYSQVPLGCS